MAGRRAQADRSAWIDRGFEVLLERGATAITVEGLSRDLGVTKGSFYWHFTGRDDLLTAVLARWTERRTTEIVEAAEKSAADDPLDALRTVVTRVTSSGLGEARLYLPATEQHPLVTAALDAVTRTRIDYLADLLRRLGHPPDDAVDRARAALALALGQQLLVRAVPGQQPDDGARTRAAALTLHLLHPGAGG